MAERLPLRRMEIALFLAGLALRVSGFLFNGMSDPDVWVFGWGPSVGQLGLSHAFDGTGGYGILSYAFAGLGWTLAEFIPRFWWLPHRAVNLMFEAGILLLLIKLMPKRGLLFALLAYWVNPFFVLNGAWHGYWDAPHTLMALVAVHMLSRSSASGLGWFLVGILLVASDMFKPQGSIYFLMPTALCLGLRFILLGSAHFLGFALGVGLTYSAIAVFLWATGGDVISLPRNYLFVSGYMPILCANCSNIWRPVTRVIQWALDQPGSILTLALPVRLYKILDLAALSTAMGLILVFIYKLPALLGNPSPHDRRAACIKLVGCSGWILFGLGLLRNSDPAQHPVLLLGRYSEKYALLLGLFLAVGIIGLLASSWVVRSLEACGRGAARILETGLGGVLPSVRFEARHFYLLLVFSSLTIPQMATRAHENHTYSALVLLIPPAVASRRILAPWLVMIGTHLAHALGSYRLGRPYVLPNMQLENPLAQPLIAKIRSALESGGGEGLLRWQGRANDFLSRYWPDEPLATLLSALQFVCVVWILRELFRLAATKDLPSFLEKTRESKGGMNARKPGT